MLGVDRIVKSLPTLTPSQADLLTVALALTSIDGVVFRKTANARIAQNSILEIDGIRN